MFQSHIPARRWWRRFATVAALVGAVAGAPPRAHAATARVTWMPSGSGASIVGYSIYVRNAGGPYSASASWNGNPTAAADGSLSANVSYTAASSGVNWFAVVSRDANSESALSAELPIGTPNPCRNDSCVTKTSCDFSTFPDGYSCEDGSYCNGSEVCRSGACAASAPRNCDDGIACTVDACDENAGKCTHNGPPGCCLACDSNDPCLADACAQGECAAPEGVELEVNRMKLTNKASGVQIAAKGRFDADPSIDPSATGAVFELHRSDGEVVYSSFIEGYLIKTGAAQGRYRYARSGRDADYFSNGLTRLDFRVKGSTWTVSVKGETSLLADAFQEPTMTWMVRFGDAGCARRMNMECNHKTSLSICR